MRMHPQPKRYLKSIYLRCFTASLFPLWNVHGLFNTPALYAKSLKQLFKIYLENTCSTTFPAYCIILWPWGGALIQAFQPTAPTPFQYSLTVINSQIHEYWNLHHEFLGCDNSILFDFWIYHTLIIASNVDYILE